MRFPEPRRVVLSPDEVIWNTTSQEHIQLGVEEFHRHGFVIIENAVSHASIDRLSEGMLEDLEFALQQPYVVFNHGTKRRNLSLSPPLESEFLFSDVWANQHATAIMEKIIGPRPKLCFAGSNIQLQDPDARQAVHSDAYTDFLPSPSGIETYIFLGDTSSENASTQIWPGTHVHTSIEHLDCNGRGWIKHESFMERAKTCPPLQPTIPKGSICIRDIKLWHAGMPNYSAKPRIMVAFVWFPQWFRSQMKITLPEELRSVAESWKHVDLVSSTNFVPGYVDNIDLRIPINFTQDPAKSMRAHRMRLDLQQGRQPLADIPVARRNYWVDPPPL